MVNLLFSWGFIEILRYKQTARIKPLTENCACTFDTAHHGSDQSKPHSIGFLKEKFGVHTLSLPSISMDKHKRKFIKFDIAEFYPSISENLLNKSIAYAKSFTKLRTMSLTR